MSSEKSGERELEPDKKRVSDDIGIETTDIYSGCASLDPVYEAKARILNNAVQEIGMGKYQVRIGSWVLIYEGLSAGTLSVEPVCCNGVWLASVSVSRHSHRFLLNPYIG